MDKKFCFKQETYIEIDPTRKTSLDIAKCERPLESVLKPHLLLLFINDLKNASGLLDPVMFADDKNLF